MTGIKTIKGKPTHRILPGIIVQTMIFCLSSVHLFSQQLQSLTQHPGLKNIFSAGNTNNQDVFGNQHVFIENIGQYGEIMKDHPGMGKILYAYEGPGMPVLFTEKGVIHLQRKLEGPDEEERERERKNRKKPEEEAEERTATDKAIANEC